MSKIMGLDVGNKTIGISLSDDKGVIAFPYENYFRSSNKKDIDHLIALIVENDIYYIVVGMPLNMNGTLGFQGEITKKFIKLLDKKINYSDKISFKIEIKQWDERLSTVSAEKAMISDDVSRAKRKKNIDKIASTFILQSYLDYKNGGIKNGK